jgi:nucleoside-diphosphate-sugar epimerase
LAATTKPFALVTGATGFIGERLASRLLYRGWALRVLVRDPARLLPALSARCGVVGGDLRDPASLRAAVEGVDVVFHCAANVRTWDSWAAYREANVEGVENLLNAIASTGRTVRLVHLSSVDVYSFPVEPCGEDVALSETEFAYGRSKQMGEAVVRRIGDEKGIPYTIIRPCNVIGPNSPFIVRVGHGLRSGLMLKVDGGGANCGFVYVDNLVDSLIWAAQSEQAIGQTYNVRDGFDVSWTTFLDRLRKGIGGRGLIISLPFAWADALAGLFERLHRLLGLKGEPLLHRLIVRLFGRTCGHSVDKLRAHGGMVGTVGFDEAMTLSAAWFKVNNKT